MACRGRRWLYGVAVSAERRNAPRWLMPPRGVCPLRDPHAEKEHDWFPHLFRGQSAAGAKRREISVLCSKRPEAALRQGVKGLDSRSGTSHSANLSRTFAVAMADSLANTGIEGSARPIAHRRSGDDATHDLEAHLRAAARLAGGFAEAWAHPKPPPLPPCGTISASTRRISRRWSPRATRRRIAKALRPPSDSGSITRAPARYARGLTLHKCFAKISNMPKWLPIHRAL